jgi:hypothetical protein
MIPEGNIAGGSPSRGSCDPKKARAAGTTLGSKTWKGPSDSYLHIILHHPHGPADWVSESRAASPCLSSLALNTQPDVM